MATAVETTATEQFGRLREREDVDTYNFDHFRARHLLSDAIKSVRGDGIEPGTLAPDFELPAVGRATVRLSDLRGRPVVLHFGSYT